MDENKIIRNIKHYYALAIFLLIMGFLGICMGLWVQFFRPSSSGELMINRTLILFSIGMIASSIVHFATLETIKQLLKQNNEQAG